MHTTTLRRIAASIMIALAQLCARVAVAQPDGSTTQTPPTQNRPAAPPLVVKGHTIGESIEQFVATVGVNPQKCEQDGKHSQRVVREGSYANFCRNIARASAGERIALCSPTYTNAAKGEFPVMDYPGKTCYANWYATLSRGRLVELIVEIQAPYTYDGIVKELVAQYGEPTSTEIQTLSNAYGAKTEAGKAIWKLAAGIIIATEGVFPSRERYVLVNYASSDAFADVPPLPSALK